MKTQRLYLKQLEVGPMQNFIYLIGDRVKQECVVVDPAWEVDRVLQEAERDEMKVVAALVTHAHFDHVNGLGDFLKQVKGKIYCNREEAEFLKPWRSDLKPVESGEKISAGEIDITFLHTPGHTPGSQCFLVEDKLVSGDTLFIQACGRCDLPGGDAEQMYYSLKRLAELDEKTVLYPGHNYSYEPTSTIGQEKRWNPSLQTPSLQDFLRFRQGA
jgi:glyoxylase-like metal-dependent hydrolase (beta-lactamase superfamily II)